MSSRFSLVIVACAASTSACDLASAGTARDEEAGSVVDAAFDAPVIEPADAHGDGGVEPDAMEVDASTFDAGDAATGPGHALVFAGGNYVQAGTLSIPPDFTLEAWVRPVAYTGETYVAARDRSGQGQGQFRFGFLAGGQLFFEMTDATGSDHGLYAATYVLQSTAIPTNVWTHVAITKSGAIFTLLVNGAIAKPATASAPFVHGGPATAFRIAARVAPDGTAANGAFNGTIDEIRLWSVARSPAEITADMKHVIPPSTPGLVAYWRFDETAGTKTADEKGAAPGTLVGGPGFIVSTAF